MDIWSQLRCMYVYMLFNAFSIAPSVSSYPGGGGDTAIYGLGMCCCEGYGFQAVYSSRVYINQSVWV